MTGICSSSIATGGCCGRLNLRGLLNAEDLRQQTVVTPAGVREPQASRPPRGLPDGSRRPYFAGVPIALMTSRVSAH